MDVIFEVKGISLVEDEDGDEFVRVNLQNEDTKGFVSFNVGEDEAKKFQLGRRFRVRVSRSTK